ncbi:MAG: T9SS type A sorting domain-containing protein, partial [Bacteroidales bacterium]|nr:T9SS type A sorting domain-containing protein [Bacteroidales bacterium]
AWCSLGTATAFNSKTESHVVRPVVAFRYSDLINFRNSATCRANDTHNIAVTPQQIGNTTATIELGQSFTYRDSTIVFNDAGEFDLQWTFHNNGGCDSIINISIVVTPTTITVTPSANQHKNCGQSDPTLQYSLSENINVSGELSREEGESVGTYNYTLGTLEADGNYELVLVENSPMFEILPLQTDLPPISTCNSYDWHGNTYTLSGEYTDTLQTAAGCDSIVTLHLTINYSPDTTYIYDTVCYEYVWQSVYGNETYTESGEYTRRFYSTTGCDSIVTLRLYVTGDQIDIYAEACGSYLHNGYTYYESGDWPRGYMSEDGCYITETLHLTIHSYPQVPVVSTTPNTNCSGSGNGTISVTSPVGDGYEYSLDGENFQESPVFENLMEGDYVVTVSNGMCQKSAETTIETTVVRPNAVASASTTMVCNGGIMILTVEGSSTGDEYTYSWSGTNGFSSDEDYIEIREATSDYAGEYSLTVTNTETGCDNTVSITVVVNEATFGTDVVTACDSYTWIDGITYTESTNEPIFELENANGCDSIVTLNLTIVHSVAITEEISICPSELPYEYNGEQYTEAGTYEIALETENHCDSIVTLVLNVYEQPEVTVSQVTNGTEITLTAEGASTYEWETGETTASITIEAANDTLWVIGYNEYQCADTAEVVISDLSSVDGIEATINVYPVPSNGVVFVEGDGINSLEVLDLSGKLIKKSVPTSTVTEIDMDVPSGEYMLRIETTNGILTHKILVIK